MVDDETRSWTEAPGAQARVVPIASGHQQVDVVGHRANDLTFHPSPAVDQLRVRTAEPRGTGGEQLGGRLVRNILELGGGFAPAESPPYQANRCRLGYLAHIGRRHVQQRDAGLGGKVLSGRIHAALPRSLDQPDDDPHGSHHPTNFNEIHSATVAAISTKGTVMTPRRMNSRMGSS